TSPGWRAARRTASSCGAGRSLDPELPLDGLGDVARLVDRPDLNHVLAEAQVLVELPRPAAREALAVELALEAQALGTVRRIGAAEPDPRRTRAVVHLDLQECHLRLRPVAIEDGFHRHVAAERHVARGLARAAPT